MAGASRRPLLPSPRLLYLSLLIILASAYSTPALPIKSKPGLLDKIVYVSEDPAIQRWRSEIGGAGIYPAHYALKALDLLPSRNNAPRHMRGRERRRRRSSIIGDDDPISPLTAVHAVARRNSLEVRRRRKKGKNRDGHDDKGYDDGSWRGDDGDYGAVGTGGTDDDDAQNYDSEKAYQEDSQERASSRYSDDYLAGDADRAGSDAGEDSRYPQTAEDTDTVFRPGRQNSKFKSHDLGEFDTEGDEAEQSWRAPGSSRASGDASEPVSENQSQRQDSDASNDQDLEVKQADLYGQDGGNRIKAPAQTRHFDCKALKTFYDDMGGPEWTDSTGWADSETSEGNLCCRAYGVSCNSLGRVTALDLGQNGLSGSLSPSLFELSYLNRLNLSANAISGEVPDKFDTLPRLSTVYLDQNKLKGSLPLSLQESSSISSVHISNNSLEGSLAFSNARNLTQLYAARNRFTNVDITVNSALVKVALDDNQFNCTLPDISLFTSLQVFSVARNHFAGSPPNVTNLQQLVKLDLQANNLSGTFPDVTVLPRLQYLGLNGNSDLSGLFPAGKAPSNLITCHVDTVLASSCPPQTVMDDPDSLAAKCSLNCRGGGRPANATPEAGTPENIVTASQPTNEKQDPSKQRLVNESDIGQTPASLAESLKSSGESRHRSLPKMYVSFIVPLLMCLV